MAEAKLGSGGRFKAFVQKAVAGGGSADAAAAEAAAAGRKKYGNKRFAKMAAAGKKSG